MRTPKLTHYKRPMLFFQYGSEDEHYQYSPHRGSRLRIVYPDGKSQWKSYYLEYLDLEYVQNAPWDWHCYGFLNSIDELLGYYSQFRSPQAAIRAMRKYDKMMGFPPADFLGFL